MNVSRSIAIALATLLIVTLSYAITTDSHAITLKSKNCEVVLLDSKENLRFNRSLHAALDRNGFSVIRKSAKNFTSQLLPSLAESTFIAKATGECKIEVIDGAGVMQNKNICVLEIKIYQKGKAGTKRIYKDTAVQEGYININIGDPVKKIIESLPVCEKSS